MHSAPAATNNLTSTLTWEEWVATAHCLVNRALDDVGARGLFIKGPLLTAQGLREPHQSVDVDVLVEPDRLQHLLDRLADIGWTVAVPPTSAQTLGLHSTTVRHARWPLEIDVHDRFPGFLADTRIAFDALWTLRTSAELAGRPLPCPDPIAHSTVAALHWLRDPDLNFHQAKLAYLADAIRPRLGDANRRALSELVQTTGSATTLEPFLRALDIEVARTPQDDSMWRIRTASTGVKTVPWLVELGRTPLRRLPGRVAHALVLTEAEIRHAQPDAAPGAMGLFRARLRRIRRGLHDLPKAVQIVWRESRRK